MTSHHTSGIDQGFPAFLFTEASLSHFGDFYRLSLGNISHPFLSLKLLTLLRTILLAMPIRVIPYEMSRKIYDISIDKKVKNLPGSSLSIKDTHYDEK